MMTSKYAKLEQEIAEIAGKIEEASRQQKEVHQRIAAAPSPLDRLLGELKSALVGGRKLTIIAAEKALAEAKRNRQRDIGLSESLRIKLMILGDEKIKLIEQRDKIIVKNAGKWFDKEIEHYEQAREQLLRSARRLTACSTILHACGSAGRELAEASLGKSWAYFRTMKIPSVKNFTAAAYEDDRLSPDLTPTPEERMAVKTELIQPNKDVAQ